MGAILPDVGPSRELVAGSSRYARELGIASVVVPIGPVVAAVAAARPPLSDRIARGNVAARVRMIIVYDLARERNRRVLGTGNKSEILLGYFTKYGDGGVDLQPLGDLYKTEVWELAERVGVPEEIRSRVPTAGFWEGQTDEAELGLDYRSIDRILLGLEELRSEEEIASIVGQPLEVVRAISQRVRAHRHKRRLPPIPKVGLRTVGIDWKD